LKLPEHLHPDMQILLDARESVSSDASENSIGSYRKFWEQYYRAIPNPRPDTIEIDDSIVSVAQHEVPVWVYRPASVQDIRRHAGPRGLQPYLPRSAGNDPWLLPAQTGKLRCGSRIRTGL